MIEYELHFSFHSGYPSESVSEVSGQSSIRKGAICRRFDN